MGPMSSNQGNDDDVVPNERYIHATQAETVTVAVNSIVMVVTEHRVSQSVAHEVTVSSC